MDMSLEIPRGKRTFAYRALEMLPGVLSYGIIVLLFILSFVDPRIGAIYLLIMIAIVLVRAAGITMRTIQGFKSVKRACLVDWRERFLALEDPHRVYEEKRECLIGEYECREHKYNLKKMAAGEVQFDARKVMHAVIMVAYNESLEILTPSVEAVARTTFDNKRIIFVLGYEERGGEEMERNAQELKKRFEGVFYDFLLIKHPDGLKGEIKGKGPNLTYAGEALERYLLNKKIAQERVIVTSLDSDNKMHKSYLDYVAYEYVVRENRKKCSFQPVSLFTNNIWEASAPMRLIAISNSFFNIITAMRPHALRNFASHSQPMEALAEMRFWSKRTIVEDGHQYWRSLFHFKGDYEVVSIKVPIYQDAVMEETFAKTLKAQFVQLRRWDYGASDVAYVGVRLLGKKKVMPFSKLFPQFCRLLDGHVMLAAMSPMVAFGGWVPKIMNGQVRELLAYNLPAVVSNVQMVASIGLMVTIMLSMKMLPKRPKRYGKQRTFGMVLQWLLLPVVAIIYQSFAAFYAQTRLLIGRYMENFDVTKKISVE